jgi:hypothetical protein
VDRPVPEKKLEEKKENFCQKSEVGLSFGDFSQK